MIVWLFIFRFRIVFIMFGMEVCVLEWIEIKSGCDGLLNIWLVVFLIVVMVLLICVLRVLGYVCL